MTMGRRIRNKEVGLLSAITILSQLISGNISNRNMDQEMTKLQTEIVNLRLERAERYVTKNDFRMLELKVDKANDQLQALKVQASSLKSFLNSKLHYNYSFFPQTQHASNEFMFTQAKTR